MNSRSGPLYKGVSVIRLHVLCTVNSFRIGPTPVNKVHRRRGTR